MGAPVPRVPRIISFIIFWGGTRQIGTLMGLDTYLFDVCSLNSYSFRSSSGTYGTVVVLRVLLNVGVCVDVSVESTVESSVLYVLDERVKL